MLLPRCCPLCDVPGEAPCAACRAGLRGAGQLSPLRGLASVRALYAYEGGARSLVLGLKYRNRRDATRWLGAQLVAVVPEPVEVITWAPTSARRRGRRGFDQAELLARAAARAAALPARGLLRRSSVGAQTGRGAGERLAGPEFIARRGVPDQVLLVDDVGTTGATLVAAAAALRGAGATAVHAVVVAWTPARRARRDTGDSSSPDVALWAHNAPVPNGG
ncbi:MAG TPA: phosphoribosyltransferase family protein [Acidimicrobiales bacterium]|nr:phosphoribosyltransferase family protein [Acidimicrobiales bacterium]